MPKYQDSVSKYLQEWKANNFQDHPEGEKDPGSFTYKLAPKGHTDRLFPTNLSPDDVADYLLDMGYSNLHSVQGPWNPNFFQDIEPEKIMQKLQHASPDQLVEMEKLARKMKDTEKVSSPQFWQKIYWNTRMLNHGINKDEYSHRKDKFMPFIVEKEKDNLNHTANNLMKNKDAFSPVVFGQHLGRLYGNPFINEHQKEEIQREILSNPEAQYGFSDQNSFTDLFRDIKKPDLQRLALDQDMGGFLEVNPNPNRELVQEKIDNLVNKYGRIDPNKLGGPWGTGFKYLADRHLPYLPTDGQWQENEKVGASLPVMADSPDISEDKLLDFAKNGNFKQQHLQRFYQHNFPDQYNEQLPYHDHSPHSVEVNPKVDYLKRIKGAIESTGQPAVFYKDLEKQGLAIPGDLKDHKGNVSIDSVDRATKLLPKTKYNVSFDKWNGVQRHDSSVNQDVFQVNVTNDMMKRMKEAGVLDTFQRINEMSKNSGHPVEGHTLGWARLDLSHPEHAHIDEIQSDLGQNLVDAISKAKQEGNLPQEYSDLEPEKLKKIKEILSGGHEDINHAIFSVVHQSLRDKFPDIKTVSMDTPEDQAKQSGLSTDQSPPVHALKTYKERPKKAGYKEVPKENAMPSHPLIDLNERLKELGVPISGSELDSTYRDFHKKASTYGVADQEGFFHSLLNPRWETVNHLSEKHKLGNKQIGLSRILESHLDEHGLQDRDETTTKLKYEKTGSGLVKLPNEYKTKWKPEQTVQMKKLIKTLQMQAGKLLQKSLDVWKPTLTINTDYDVPYTAGYSIDGNTIYIDRKLPRYFVTTEKVQVDIFKYLIIHGSNCD